VHTNIVATDWQKLVRFYEDVFGCIAVPPERKLSGDWLAQGTGVQGAALEGVHLRLPGYEEGPTLEIFSYAHMKEKLPPAANRLGLGHLAFSVDDVSAVLERVIANGGQALGEVVQKYIPEVGTITFVYACDPEGNIIEIQNRS
jgi:catechol 2,3-dioxygenase-like lactoylglutathione lyase family enzyme